MAVRFVGFDPARREPHSRPSEGRCDSVAATQPATQALQRFRVGGEMPVGGLPVQMIVPPETMETMREAANRIDYPPAKETNR